MSICLSSCVSTIRPIVRSDNKTAHCTVELLYKQVLLLFKEPDTPRHSFFFCLFRRFVCANRLAKIPFRLRVQDCDEENQ